MSSSRVTSLVGSLLSQYEQTALDGVRQLLGCALQNESELIDAFVEEAQALEVKVGAPVLVTVTTMFTNDGQPGGWRRAVLLLGLLGLGVAATTVSTALGFGPAHALAWVTPSTMP